MSAVIEPEVLNPVQLAPTTSRIHAFYGGLTSRQSQFIDGYIKTGNGAKSAFAAGYGSNLDIAATRASQLLRTRKIQDEIKRRIGISVASSQEVLETLTKHARADLTDVLSPDGEFSLKAAKQKRILKKLKVKTRTDKDGNVTVEKEFEIHDPQAALDKLGRFYKLFSDKPDSDTLSIDLSELVQLIGVGIERMREQRQLDATSTTETTP